MTNGGGAAAAALQHYCTVYEPVVGGAGLQSRPPRADLKVSPYAAESEWRLQRLS
jgi:hypothetical protein